ncbi:SIR2 family protein [Lactiplantibacillus pentosus]
MGKTDYFCSSNIKLSTEGAKYYLNEQLLEREEKIGKINYTEPEFELEVSKAASKFVDRSFENIVVLIGAGASVVMTDNNDIDGRYGKTVSMIAQIVFEKLQSGRYQFQYSKSDGDEVDVFPLEQMAADIGYSDKIFDDNSDKLSLSFDLETFLSRLIMYNQFVLEDKKKWKDSQSAIFDIIKLATSYDYEKEVFHHTALINILSQKLSSENKLSVVTTNYDTLIEDAAESMGYTVFDGFSFSSTPHFDDDMFEWHLSKHVSDVKTKENIYKKNVIDLLKIHGSLTWRISKSGENVIRTDKHASGESVMIFPSSDKYMQSYEEPYFELFARFQDLLKRPNTLLLTTGFSFADNHISRMIIQAISHNPSLSTLITDYSLDLDKPNKNWKELKHMLENANSVAFLKATLNKDLTKYLMGYTEGI